MSGSAGVGLVGAGRIAALHAAALRELDVPLVGVVSSSPQRSAEAALRLGAERSYDTLEQLLADPRITTVHITTPTALHAAGVEQALRAGKHVVCEKPLTTDAEQSERLARLAEESELVGAVAYTYRYHPVAREMRARAAEIGDLRLCRASYLQEWMLEASADEWRLDPDRNGPSRVLADIGCHAIDLIEFVTRERVDSVSAIIRGARIRGQRENDLVDDIAVLSFTLAGGTIGSVELAQVAIGHTNTLAIELSGAHGSVALDLRDAVALWEARPGLPAQRAPLTIGSMSGEQTFLPSGTASDYTNAYVALLRDVQRAIGGEIPADLPTFRSCLHVHRVREAALLAHARRAWIDIGIQLVEPPAGRTDRDHAITTLA